MEETPPIAVVLPLLIQNMPGIQPPNELIKSWEWERERQQKKKKLDERVERMKGGRRRILFYFQDPPLQSKVETGLVVPESLRRRTERQSYPSFAIFFFCRLVSVPC